MEIPFNKLETIPFPTVIHHAIFIENSNENIIKYRVTCKSNRILCKSNESNLKKKRAEKKKDSLEPYIIKYKAHAIMITTIESRTLGIVLHIRFMYRCVKSYQYTVTKANKRHQQKHTMLRVQTLYVVCWQ